MSEGGFEKLEALLKDQYSKKKKKKKKDDSEKVDPPTNITGSY